MAKQGINPYKGGPIPKNRIEWAIQNTNSMKESARELHVSYNTFKKYCKLYDLWSPNQGHKGSSKPKVDKMWNVQVHDIFEGKYPNYPHWKLQKKLLHEGYLKQSCNGCGYSQYRESDLTSPLLLNFKDKDTSNMELSNLELLCYNCYFINNTGSKPGHIEQQRVQTSLNSIKTDTLQKKLMKAFK